MFKLILFALSWLVKNIAYIVGILEALVKVIVGIITLTPTKRDDFFVDKINDIFSAVKKFLYDISDFMAGKEL